MGKAGCIYFSYAQKYIRTALTYYILNLCLCLTIGERCVMRCNIMGQTTLQGVPGILRPFKEYIEKRSLPAGSEVVFYGVPGTCTPFVELLCFAIRSLPVTCIFVPYTGEDKAHTLGMKADVGFQAKEQRPPKNPAVVVIMGGLAMPNMPVSADDVAAVLNKWKGAGTIGICFMHMFEKADWLDKMHFDLLIDADISVTAFSE